MPERGRNALLGLLTQVCLLAWAARGSAAEPAKFTLEVQLGETYVEGRPLYSSTTQVELLARDGRLWSFAPSDARKSRQASATFTAYTPSQVRAQLQREFGRRFEVTGTGHYLVAHPPGQRDAWGKRFEDLYRSFVHYFHVRGFDLAEPEFPLVALVWPSQQDFLRHAQQDGVNISNNVLGYYSPISNRISLFDSVGTSANSEAWQQNADTVIHEATHQTAFNTGVHSRFFREPRWVVEGLGTMFEAPGVWDSRDHPRRDDRINHGRLTDFKQLQAAQRAEGLLADILSSDRLFDTDPAAAYAMAWSLSFFLVESYPRKYSEYLKRTARYEAFADYPSQERLRDFTAVFGTNLRLVEARFLRFMAGVD